LLSGEREKKDKVGPVILYGGKINTRANYCWRVWWGIKEGVLTTL
jgi:hypothetical protein